MKIPAFKNVNKHSELIKMTKIFGKVISVGLYDAPENSGCLTTCFESVDCILAYFDSADRCLLFNFNSTQTLEVEETTKADGFFVAFKVCVSIHLSVCLSVCPDVYGPIFPRRSLRSCLQVLE